MQHIGWVEYRLINVSLYRRLTDRKVYCTECGGFIGYFWRKGHQRWKHVDCATALVTAV